MTGIVVEQRIRRHLAIALTPRPVFGGIQKRSPVTLSTKVVVDVPGFDIPNRSSIATFGVRTRASFYEAGKRAICMIEDKNFAVRARAKLAHALCQIPFRTAV